MLNASLVAVGLGIKFVSHVSIEAKTYIEQSEKVLYLVNDPLMKKWIQRLNPNTESLDKLYLKYTQRADCYKSITNYILKILYKNQHVCVALYGHPCVFAEPALNAIKIAKENGYFTKILPAISAEDCLFADLLIDPGSCGCQSFEATDFLIFKRHFDTCSHLILWQVGIIGNLKHTRCNNDNQGVSILADYLKGFYSPQHEVTLYEAARYPDFNPRIEKIDLKKLNRANLSKITTLYVPPNSNAKPDLSMLRALGMQR